ncbi:MAG: hypothetical protein ACOYM0_07065 [Bacteroidales bacterium]
MKTLTRLFLYFSCIIFLYSCSNIPQVSRKKAIGSWKLEQLVSIGEIKDAADQKAAAAQSKSSEISNRDLKNAMVDARKGSFSKLSDIYPDLKDALEFRSDNTASLTMHGKTIGGTWKINEQKNGIIFTETGKTQILKLSISELNSQSMCTDEPMFLGLMRLSYEKK